jgi:hypothetical protein
MCLARGSLIIPMTTSPASRTASPMVVGLVPLYLGSRRGSEYRGFPNPSIRRLCAADVVLYGFDIMPMLPLPAAAGASRYTASRASWAACRILALGSSPRTGSSGPRKLMCALISATPCGLCDRHRLKCGTWSATLAMSLRLLYLMFGLDFWRRCVRYCAISWQTVGLVWAATVRSLYRYPGVGACVPSVARDSIWRVAIVPFVAFLSLALSREGLAHTVCPAGQGRGAGLSAVGCVRQQTTASPLNKRIHSFPFDDAAAATSSTKKIESLERR